MKSIVSFVLLLSLFPLQVFSITGAEYATQLKALNDGELYDKAVAGKVGKCFVFDASACQANGQCYCDRYVQTKKTGTGSIYPGLPGKDNKPYGSGCAYTQKVPTCWGAPNTYVASTMCTSDYKANAGAMIRAALNATGDLCDLNAYAATLSNAKAVDIMKAFKQGNVFFAINSNNMYDPEVCYVKGVPTATSTINPTPEMCKELARTARADKPDLFTKPVVQTGSTNAVATTSLAQYYGAMPAASVAYVFSAFNVAKNAWVWAAIDVRRLDLAKFIADNPNPDNNIQKIMTAINNDLAKLAGKLNNESVQNVIYGYVTASLPKISALDKLASFFKLPTDSGFIAPVYTIETMPSNLVLEYDPATKNVAVPGKKAQPYYQAVAMPAQQMN